MLRAAAAFVGFWEYTRRPEIQPLRLRGLGDRLVRLERRLAADFAAIAPRCLTLSLLYVSYLLEVARDTTRANAILEALAFNEDFEVNLHLNHKVFVEVGLEGEAPGLARVGANASLLLGFERRELEGQGLEVLLPEFFRRFHSASVAQCLELEFARLYLYCKKTVVRNRWGYYEECNVMLRLHLDPEGALLLRGYLELRPNPAYSWPHFLFISENEEILECAESLGEFAPSATRLHRAAEIFPEVRLYKPLYQKTPDNIIEYHPLLVFEIDTQKVFYYVRALPSEPTAEAGAEGDAGVGQLLETMQLRKFDWEFVRGYYLRAQEVMGRLYSREYLLLAVVGVAAVGGLLGCEGYLVGSAAAQARAEQACMGTARQVFSYYDSSMALGMRIAFVGLKLAYNYSNTISSNNVLNLSLVLQTNNERLKGFTSSTYALPSLIPNVTYSKPNYDLIVELLSNAYMIRQFSDDAFLQSTVLARAQLSLHAIFANSVGEYEASFVQTVRQAPPGQGDFFAMGGVLVLLGALCVGVWRVDVRLRGDEQRTLTLLASVHSQDDLIATARQFTAKITREDAALRAEEEPRHKNAVFNTSLAPDTTARDGASRSEMSLREMSGRDLLGDSFNRSGVLQTVLTARVEQPASFASQNQEIALSPRKRWLLGVGLGLAGVIGGVVVAGEAVFGVRGKIDLSRSVSSLFTLFATGGLYSRSMILFLNLVALRANGPIDSTQYDTFTGNYPQGQTLVTLPEGDFPEFAPFQGALSQLTYQYMCSYLSCDPAFAGEVNIVYSTTIQKVMAGAAAWKGQLNQMATAAVGPTVRNGSMTHFIDLVYYSEVTIRAELLSVVSLYLDCFTTYSNALMLRKQLTAGAALALTLVGLGLLVSLMVYVGRHQGLLRDLARVIKTDSYINEDNPIADKQMGRAEQK